MGAWGLGPFENDMAADLRNDLRDAADASDLVVAALARVLDDEDVEEPDGSEAVGAAAAVVGLLTDGAQAAALAPEVEGIALDAGRRDELLELSARALDRVLAPGSELLDLWEEAEEDEPFRASLVDLRAACSGAV